MKITLVSTIACAVILLGIQGCKSSGGVTGMVDEGSSPGASTGSAKVVPTVQGLPPDPGPAAIPRISEGDLLQLEVFQAPEMSTKERVMASGEIFLPLVGAVKVAGLTQEEAEQLITRKLSENYLQNPQVNLFVEESASLKVTVVGEVGAPGVFPLKGQMTLLEAIALARGVKGTAKDEVVLFRKTGPAGIKAYIIDIGEIEEGSLANPPLIGGDTVHVVQSGTMVFFDRIFGKLALAPVAF
jgi:polysaccharide export outer membrane protein